MATFLDKNKKKSGLALLLFLWRHKRLSALALAVALASSLFVGQSYLGGGSPGGGRGVGGLLAALRAAKENGGGRVGWSASTNGAGAGSGSLGFVKGSRKDLETAGGVGAKLPKTASVGGILSPDDAKNRGEGDAVALSAEDVSGERAVLARGSELSGGAFANKGFFGGSQGAVGDKLRDKVDAALEGVGGVKTAKGVEIKGAGKSRLSAFKASAIDARHTKGMSGARAVSGQRAFAQLASGRGRAALSVAPACDAQRGCPSEFASAVAGSVYDGNNIAGADILSGGPHAESTGVAVPSESDVPGGADPARLEQCADAAEGCERNRQEPLRRLGDAQTRLNGLVAEMGRKCGDPCDCDPCRAQKDRIQALCDGDLKTALQDSSRTCSLPASCDALSVEPPASTRGAGSADLCETSMYKCGCNNFFCDAGCFLGL